MVPLQHALNFTSYLFNFFIQHSEEFLLALRDVHAEKQRVVKGIFHFFLKPGSLNKNAESLNFGTDIYLLQTFPLKYSEVIARINAITVISQMHFIIVYQGLRFKTYDFLSKRMLFTVMFLGGACHIFSSDSHL